MVDPELLGMALHNMLPAERGNDFQDLPQWRSGVLATLEQAHEGATGPLIVPMTIVRDEYFDEIIGGLRSRGVNLRHYSLIASPEILRERLRKRSGYLAARLIGRDERWAIAQIDRCVTALRGDRYATHIQTDELALDDVVEWIAAEANLTLERPRLPSAQRQLRQLVVGLRHIRI